MYKSCKKEGIIVIFPQDNLHRALADARPGGVLELGPGEFRCKAMVTVPGLTIRGAGADRTKLVWDDYAQKKDARGREYNTFRTWTLAVCADGVTVCDLSVVNDAGAPEKLGQEVALTVYADGFRMERCTLSSTQDTLFLGPLPRDLIKRYDGFLPALLRRDAPCRQSFRDCRIEGTVDFIFGCGEAVFENCELRSLRDARDIGYIAAPAHAPEQEAGFLFHGCALTAQEGVSPASVFLARPWRDYGLCEFRGCAIMGSHISPLGFDKWNDTHRDRTARFYETPLPRGRVPWARTRDASFS